ncbi:MAM and LDL-receptor class A domain-containing protein 1-like isoform X1 [Mytilus galloprovincialis]|uniref:MAM and LDL-receptor class A domain-containing protein 1-like isoform X1 n=1 Tax=Mytilus galloprovincialis TaxID=29158 RepID=UPI003F7B76CD
MKITLFYVFVFWTICLITSHKIPPQYFRNTKDVNNLNELEQLLKERTNEGKDQKEAEEARKTSLHTEEEMKEEQENSDDEEEIERASQGADEREMNDYDRIKDPQERLGHKLHTAQTYLDRSGKVNARKTEESMTTFPDKERLLTEKINEWRTTNENEKEDAEELPVDHPEAIDPDDPVSNLLEGMEIENNGHPHLVQGLHPEDSAKTYGDSHDSHKLIPEQIAELELDSEDSGSRKRNFYTNTNYLWKKRIVPYRIYNMSTSSITVINKAIKQFHDFTCIKWVTTSDPLFNPTELGHQNVITFINAKGCWSYVGNVNPKRNNIQYLGLAEPGCISVGTSVHEMLHAIGGKHEQSRADRDNYITIEWPNVKKGRNNNNMVKANTQDNNPYDAESAMQYSLYAFSTNGKKTIQFKDQRLEFLADSADGLEFYDIQDVTDAYKCTDHCTNIPNCQNGGFLNFQCTCTCPDVLTGTICEGTVSNSQTCGGVINLAAGEERLIQSPNYPSNYPTGLECTWLVKGTANNIVRASVQYMDISADAACNHWLEYRYNLLGQKGPKKCGTNFVADEEIWDSTPDELSNAMIIRFDSNTFSTKPAAKGFSIKVQSIGKGCVTNPCMNGKCSSPEGTSDYTCTCNQGVSGKDCDMFTSSAVVKCTFEYGERCIFETEANHELNWDYQSLGTRSSNTGPDNAHTGFQYVYIEASGKSRQAGDKAVMSTNIQLSNVDYYMTFWYHMKGSKMGTLNIYTEGTTTAKSIIWTRSGSQGNDWVKGKVNITAMHGLKISIESIRGSGWSSDIAIDDISLTPGTRGGSQLKTCSFEAGASCFLVEATNDDFDWTPISGESPSSGTGPKAAYEGSTYKYIEVSSPVTSNSVARLMSSSSLNGGDHCLTFAYHMFGSDDMGELKISTGVTAPDNELFKESGNHDDQWNKGMVTFTTSPGMKLFVEANKRNTWKGDIAIDDFQLKSGSCDGGSQLETCSFEVGASCFLVEATNDDFDWTPLSGESPSSGTGPKAAYEGSMYKYIEVSSPVISDSVARLMSSSSLNGGDHCLTFAYHMFGANDMGELKISTGVTAPDNELFIESGNHDDQWNKGMVTFTTSPGMKLFIEANKGNTWQGDIAIDDIQLKSGSCDDLAVTFRCDFETDAPCIFKESSQDEFDWTRHSLTTPSTDTGPEKAATGIYYIYTEASYPRTFGDKAVLTTEATTLQDTSWCLCFNYHMKGSDIGILEVFAGDKTSSLTSIWQKTGEQSDPALWKSATIDVQQYSNPVITIEGIRGSSYDGDIAIDDISLSSGGCNTRK